MASPLETAAKMIVKRLTGDKDLMQLLPGGVHRDEAPAKTETPFLVYTVDSNGSESSLGSSVGVVEAEAMARIVSKNDEKEARLFARILSSGNGIGVMEAADVKMNALLTGWREVDSASKMELISTYGSPYNTTFSGGGFDGLPAIGATFRLQLMPDDGGNTNG